MYAAFSFDAIFSMICEKINRNPMFECAPRGEKIREDVAVTFTVFDPQCRFINNPARNSNYGFGVGEFLWYWQGRDDLDMMLYYNKRMRGFSNDGKTLNSAYGWRLKKALYSEKETPSMNQWDIVKKTLIDDSDSRRAVMLINSPYDEYEAATRGSKDVPCTLALQFFIRDNALHLHTTMRSNDVMWGLTYDLFSFTLFQECMLLELKKEEKFKDLELGSYHHTAGSLHIYEKHFAMADRIVEEYDAGSGLWQVGVMEPLTSLESLAELCKDEELLRKGNIQTIDLGKYQGGERWMAERLNEHRIKRDKEKEA